jgi:hypothetical protein
MKEIEIATRKTLNLKEYKYRVAKADDCQTVVNEPCKVYEDGQLKIVYAELRERLPRVVSALQAITYDRNHRTGGLPTNSRILGYAPRSTLRKDFCGSTSLAVANPIEHGVIAAGARVAESYYRELNPSLHESHAALAAEKVKDGWRIEGSVFTSGIINKNNQLRYHHDAGNFRNVWSAMLVFKSEVEGGYLSIPEYDLVITLRDHSVLLFDGQGLLHGVTPFNLLSPHGYRYSIVYYSLQQMWNCLTPKEELSRIRKLKTEREYRRAEIAK